MSNNHESQMVVADKYKLLIPISRINGTYDKEGTKKHISKKVVSRSFVEDRNSHPNNELYIIDEDATAEFLKYRAESLKNKEISKAKKTVGMDEVVEAIAEMKAEKLEAPKKRGRKPKADSTEESND